MKHSIIRKKSEFKATLYSPVMTNPAKLKKRHMFENTDENSVSWGSTSWGSRSHTSNETDGMQSGAFLKDKRLFTVVWRKISNKKHKTWQGDGSLEVQNKHRAVLKDDTGKYLGSTNLTKGQELEEGIQIVVGGKEIELQNEIKSNEEYWAFQKQQMANRGWGEEEWEPKEQSEKKPKGAFVFRPVLVLNGPKMREEMGQIEMPGGAPPSLWGARETNQPARQSPNNRDPLLVRKREYICFLHPTELQLLLLQKASELYEKQRTVILKDMTPRDIIAILKNICNHPVLVMHTKFDNYFTRTLEFHLPYLSDIGPSHSAKMEVVQQFLNITAVKDRQSCVLVSNHTQTVHMLEELCDNLNLNTIRMDTPSTATEHITNVEKVNLPPGDANKPTVFLLNAKVGDRAGINLAGASRVILYDDDWTPDADAQLIESLSRNAKGLLDLQIYRLVTAGCIEETLFQRQLNDCSKLPHTRNEDLGEFSAELGDLLTLQADFSISRTHQQLNCNCQGDGQNCTQHINPTAKNQGTHELMHWEHYKPPFPVPFLEEACLQHSSDNILYVFSKKSCNP